MKTEMTKKEIIEQFMLGLTDEECKGIISIWSMRPQPGTPRGQAWEEGALWGWQKCRDSAARGINKSLNKS